MAAFTTNSILLDNTNSGDIAPSGSGQLWFNELIDQFRVQTETRGIQSLSFFEDLQTVSGLIGTVPTFQDIYDGEGGDVSFTLDTSGSLTISDQDNILFQINDGGSVSLIPGVAGGTVNVGSDSTSGNLIIHGSLTVLGTTIEGASETVIFGDNTLLLNSGEVGAGVTAGFAGLEIERGSSTNAELLFAESASTLFDGTATRWVVDYGDGSGDRVIATEDWVGTYFIDTSEISIISGDILTTVNASINAATLLTKAGQVTGGSFTGGGGNNTSAVTFGTAFGAATYSISVMSADPDDNFNWTISSRATTGFTINSNSNKTVNGPVTWIATIHGETVAAS